MKISALICGAIVAATVPAAALADDPRDPAMRNAAARVRDSAATRELNRQENSRVLKRGVTWRVVRDGRSDEAGDGDYAAASQDHERDMAEYRRSRARYEREMAEWRRAVAACDAGDYAACDN
ncbi:hypothetical protein [Sphingomonas asaccharolytica]|uniref:hypothetical protein n=1 Tax=Sphingomonas asaccharolytica TaxID=40681 RepID=UPI00082ED937|nr:hypothetical protein [Sphingomonas asaccharolytica]